MAVLSGLLTAISFPDVNFYHLAWLSLIPLLILVFNSNPKKSFFTGIISGTVYFSVLLYWIAPTFTAAGEPVILGILSLLSLAVYLSIFTGFFCLITAIYFKKSEGGTAVILFAPLIWTGIEYIRGHLFGGFPWGLLGYSQWPNKYVAQITDITGVYGVSFLIMTVNVLFAYLINSIISGDNKKTVLKKILTPSILVGAIIVLSFAYGVYSLRRHNRSNDLKTLRIAVLQGNIDQYKKWDNEYSEGIITTYENLALEAAKDKPDIIIWPESALPCLLNNDKILRDRISRLCKKTNTWHLVGAVDLYGGDFYNSALLLNASGTLVGRYDKIHLVPFGETIPLKTFLGKFIKTLNELGEISPGKEYKVLPLGFHERRELALGANICFEAIFPEIFQKLSKNGARILVNLTNDAWYMNTSAPRQHFIFNVFRAIENRRYLIRAANTGISGVIGPTGRIARETIVFVPGIVVYDIPINPKMPNSFYTVFGDVFAYACILLSAALFLTTAGVFRKIIVGRGSQNRKPSLRSFNEQRKSGKNQQN